MNTFRWLKWCNSVRGISAIFVVLTSALLLGYYGWLTLIAPPIPTYNVDFGKAQWIGPSDDGPNGYFRKKIFVSNPVVQAWIEVAGSDNFRLYVNNSAISNPDPAQSSPGFTGTSVSANPTAIIDISRYLYIGTNVIAIHVLRDTYPGGAKAIVRGEIRFMSGRREILSDGTWKAVSTLGLVQNLLPWTDALQDDYLWPDAKTLGDQYTGPALYQPAVVPPELFQEPLHGLWLTDSRSSGKQVNFTKRFDLIPGGTQTWLQIAASCSYTVMLNGHWLEDHVPMSPVGLYSPVPPSIQFVWLQPWLRLHDNELVIRAQAIDSAPLVIGQISFLSDRRQVLGSIGTDQSWTASDVKSQVIPGQVRQAQTIKAIQYTGDRWGEPPRVALVAPLSMTETTYQNIRGTLMLVGVAVAVLGFWLFSGWMLAMRKDYRLGDALCFDALLHVPVLLAVPILLLLRFDVRLHPEAPMRPEFFFLLLALIVVLRLVAWLLPLPRRKRQTTPAALVKGFSLAQMWSKHWFGIALGIIVIFAFYQRVIGINAFPLHHDDIFIQNCARGIYQKGYPGLNYGGVPLRLTTYELIPYPIALCTLLLGWSDWVVRIPALVFGTLTTLVLGRFGRSLFGPRVGLLAAFLYSCNPWEVYWSLHCFHPQQEQFFTLLCAWAFYSAIREPNQIDKKHFYRCCVLFILAYLSWEGAGFDLPALALALLVLHPGRWGWLRQFHLWVGLFVIGAVIVMQFASRYMGLPPYIGLGYSLADLGSPTPYFLDPQCQPLFYLQWVYLVGPHFILTILFALGVLFVRKNRPLRFIMVVFGTLLLSFSVFLPAYSTRYCYFFQEFVLLGASAVLFMIFDRIAALIRRWEWPMGRTVFACTMVGALFLVIATNTDSVLMLHRIGGDKVSQTGMSYWLRWEDTRSASRFVAANRRPGDVVIARLTQAMERYGGKLPDYALDDLLEPRIVYDRNLKVPNFEHRQVNIPVLYDYDQVEKVLQEGHRVWYISPVEISSTAAVLKTAPQVLTASSREVYCAYNSYVYLYEGLIPDPDKVLANLAVPPNPPLTVAHQSLLRSAEDPVNPPAAQVPFKQPLTPTVQIYPQAALYDVPKPAAPDGMLVPGISSLQPALKPSPTPLLAPPLLRQ
jgi:hypothetical protein